MGTVALNTLLGFFLVLGIAPSPKLGVLRNVCWFKRAGGIRRPLARGGHQSDGVLAPVSHAGVVQEIWERTFENGERRQTRRRRLRKPAHQIW
jgi:hypothetical protein